jgi:hypothetical protein
MSKISSSTELREAIQLLEFEQEAIGQDLKEHVNVVRESLRPVNLLKSTMSDVASSDFVIDNIVGTALGIGTGYISRKLIIGSSLSPVRKLFGSALQLAVTTVTAKKIIPVTIMGRFLVKKIFGKKEIKPLEE